MESKANENAMLGFDNEEFERGYAALLKNNLDERMREIIMRAQTARRNGEPFRDYEEYDLCYDDFWQSKKKSGDYNLYYYMFQECPPRGELKPKGVKALRELIERALGTETDGYDESEQLYIRKSDAKRTCKMFGIGEERVEEGWTKRDFYLLRRFLREEAHERRKGQSLYDLRAKVIEIFATYGNPRRMSKVDKLEVKLREMDEENQNLKAELEEKIEQLNRLANELKAEKREKFSYMDKLHNTSQKLTRSEENREREQEMMMERAREFRAHTVRYGAFLEEERDLWDD